MDGDTLARVGYLAIILVALLFYIKFAGTEALMGEDEEAR